MNPKQLLIAGGLAGAAYWVWKNYGGDLTSIPAVLPPSTPGTTPIQTNATPTTIATPIQSNSGPTQTQSAPAPAPAPPPAGYATLDPVGAPNFSGYIAATIGPGRHLLSADEWNWYFTEFSHIPQTADLFLSDNRGETISLTEYLGRRTAAGLSGMLPAGNYIQRGQGL